MTPRRIQRQRTRGWRMPVRAVYIGRPTPWGNPFRWDDEGATWMAVAVGQRADEIGRRTAAVSVHRWWLTEAPITALIPTTDPTTLPAGTSVLVYTSGRAAPITDLVSGLGLRMWIRDGLVLPPRPDLEPLRGRDLVCWCPLDQPCHADVLLELANRG